MVADDKEMTIVDLMNIIAKYFSILFFTPVTITLIIFISSFFMTERYTALVTFFSDTGSSGGGSSIPAFVMGGMTNPFDTFKSSDGGFVDLTALIESRRFLLRVAEKENVKDFYGFNSNHEALEILKKEFGVGIDEKTKLQGLGFTSTDPEFSKRVVLSGFEELQILNDEIVSTKVKIKVKFFEDKIKETIEKLNESEELIYSSKFKGQAFTSLDPNNELGIRARAYEQLQRLQDELEVKKNIYGEGSKFIQQLRNQIKVLTKNSTLNPIDQEQLKNLKEWREIYRDYLYYSAALRSHINNFEIAKLEEAGGTHLAVLDYPIIDPDNPSFPRKKRLTFYTFIISSFLTIFFVFVYEFYSRLSESDKRKVFGR